MYMCASQERPELCDGNNIMHMLVCCVTMLVMVIVYT